MEEMVEEPQRIESMQDTTTAQCEPDVGEKERRIPRKIAPAALLLLIFLVMSQLVHGIYIGLGLEQSGGFSQLQHLGLFWLAGDWLLKDTRDCRVEWAFDMGFFLFIAWPLIVPYYLFKTRGFKALWIILALIGSYLGAALIGMLFSFLVPVFS